MLEASQISKRQLSNPGKKGWIKVGLAMLAVVALLTVGIIPRLRQGDKLARVNHELSSIPPTVEFVSPIISAPIEDLELPSSIQAIEETTIHARTSGYLHQRFVDIGSHVKRGQLLATIESPEVDQQLSESQENLVKERAAGQQAQADVYRLRAGVVSSEAQVSQARSVLQGALADVSHARAKLIEAKGAELAARAKLLQLDRHLEGVQASLAQFQIKEQLADKTYKRWKELAAGGAVSGQDLDESQAAFETSLSAVIEAKAAVESAKADVTSAEANVSSRSGDIVAAESDIRSSEQRVNAARSALDASKSNVGAAEAGVQAGRANALASKATIRSSQSSLNRVAVLRSFEEVRAPFDGVITARNVDVGSLIGAGSGTNEGSSDPQNTVPKTGMFGLAKTDALRVQVNVPQNFIQNVHVGDEASVTSPQLPSLKVSGKVIDTAGALDVESRTLLVEIQIPNPGGKLLPGMYAQVHFKIHHVNQHLRIPSDTLIIDAKGMRVVEIKPDSTIHFQFVQVGRDLGKEVEVLDGVRSGSRLVENPSDDLDEGEKVMITPKVKS